MSSPTTGISHAALIQLFHSILPPAANHLPLIYHCPRTPHQQHRITRIILSITATPSIYPLLTPGTAIFLHRPWDLQRAFLHRSTLVLASHQRLDELLTTGYNEVLLRRLGVVGAMEEVVGYKGDPDRKMGLVGKLPRRKGDRDVNEDEDLRGETQFEDWLSLIRREFPDVQVPVYDLSDETTDPSVRLSIMEPPPPEPLYIACMNAFDPSTIDRAITAAYTLSASSPAAAQPPIPTKPPTPKTPTTFHPSQIIYLTGQPRAPGLSHAQRTGIRPMFAGHRGAEAWAVAYLADRLRAEWGNQGVEVVVVVDDEPEDAGVR